MSNTPKSFARAACSAAFIGAMSSFFVAEASTSKCDQVYQRASDRTAFPSRQSAVQHMEDARSACSKDALYASRLASFYFELGRVEESEQIVAEALATHPLSKELLFSKGDGELRHSKPADAISTAEKIIKAHPSWFGGYYLMQRAQMDSRQFTESAEYGQRAAALSNGQMPVIYLNLAVANYHSGKLEDCVKSAELAIQKDPSVLSRPWGINEAVYALASLGRRSEALSLAKRRMNADPNWQADPALVKALRVMGVIQ